MAYFQPQGNEHQLAGMKQALEFAFPKHLGYDVTLDEDWNSHPTRKDQEEVFSKFYKIDFHNRKHTVIAVQGTDPSDIADVLADIRLWLVPGVLDIAQMIIPPLNFLTPDHRSTLQWVMNEVQESLTIAEGKVSGKPLSCRFTRPVG